MTMTGSPWRCRPRQRLQQRAQARSHVDVLGAMEGDKEETPVEAWPIEDV